MLGIRGRLAEFMGISYDDKTGDIDIDETPFSFDENTTEIQENYKNIENTKKEIKNQTASENPISYNKDTDNIDELIKLRSESLKDAMKEYQEKLKIEKEKNTLISKSSILSNMFQSITRENPYLESFQAQESTKNALEHIQNLQKDLDKLKKIKNEKADDFYDQGSSNFSDINEISKGKYYFNPETNTKTYLSINDDVYAMKSGGVLQETIDKQLEKFNQNLLTAIQELKNITPQTPTVINAPVSNMMSSVVSGESSGSNKNTTGKRDPIFDTRLEWWKISTLERFV
jgi:hypothetical protein